MALTVEGQPALTRTVAAPGKMPTARIYEDVRAELLSAPGAGQKRAPLVTIIPSKGRPESVARTVRAWVETGAFTVGAIRWALNASDPRVDEYLDAIGAIGGTPGALTAVVYPNVRMVPRLNQACLDLLDDDQAGRIRAIGFQGDDHVPASEDWARRYLAVLDGMTRTHGAGMVHGDDGLRGAKLASEWCVSRSWVQTLGRMVPALVQHLYCDDAVQDLAKAAGIYRYLGDGDGAVRITHVHPLAEGTSAVLDETYRSGGLNSSLKASDHQAYLKWSMRPEQIDKTGLARQAGMLRALKPE